MNEEKAVKTLTAELVNSFGSLIVRDENYKDKLVKNTEYFYQTGNPFIICFDNFRMTNNKSKESYYIWGFVNHEHTKKDKDFFIYDTLEHAIDKEESSKGVNYFFIDTPIPSAAGHNQYIKGLSFFVTPYSIIGKKEIDKLRGLFYKDVHPDVLSAMKVLGIENYVELYELYSNGGLNKTFLEETYLKLNDSLAHAFYDDAWISNKKFEDYSGIKVSDLKKKLKRIGIECQFSYNDKVGEGWIMNIIQTFEKINSMDKFKDLLPDFFNFVFSIPYEDQDVEVNKEILKSSGGLDYIGILFKEYSQGNYFQDYFDVLDAERQKKVASSLKSVPRNTVYDSYLWGKGFKGVEMDYLGLYRKDADGFIEYFKSRELEEKKVIIGDIMDCDFINEDVANWLSENELELVKEVGLNG